MKYIINEKEHPIYLQLYRQIKDDIVNGLYPFKSKLPSKRNLAEDTGVSTITVEHAYALLCEEGYAEAKERSGYIVTFRQNDGFAAQYSVALWQPSVIYAQVNSLRLSSFAWSCLHLHRFCKP